MIEKALKGSKKYWLWVFFLLFWVLVGFLCYLHQLHVGLGMTGGKIYLLEESLQFISNPTSILVAFK